ncbi:MAG: universal stress protein [Puniceicoccales bacterium]|jgi:nucleotide-binding universal stress UspA family protein|nr:universal stress protein [Puniceicoccales bacterium]
MKNILACIDGSIYGQTCSQYALWFAQKLNTGVEALYVSELWQYEAPLVADFGGSLGAQPYMGLTAQLRQIESAKAEALRAYLTGLFGAANLADKLRFHHRTGVLSDCIGEFETTGDDGAPRAEMLILGKRGEAANMAKAHLGTNMERVVRGSALPCLVANREFFEPRRLLFATDGSASASRAIAWFVANRGAFAGAEVAVVSVAAQKPGASEKADAALADARRVLDAAGVAAAYEVLSGIPADAISARQQESGANLLLMGAYGHSRIRRLLIGSTTVELLQRCRVPVVLFR